MAERVKLVNLVEDGAVMWHDKQVPAMGDVEQVLGPRHYGEEKHCQDKKMLRKALSDKGFPLPPFMGGLE